MKRFIIFSLAVILLIFLGGYAYYYQGWYVDLNPDAPVVSQTAVEGKTILLDQGSGLEEFEIRGVDLGTGIPGHFATDYAISEETYLRWFQWIQEMGANTIRVYTVLDDSFYNAFYQYNQGREEPLYLLQGLWVNDYAQNSHVDAYDDSIYGALLEDCRTLVDVVHGSRVLSLGRGLGSGSYTKDISPWVLGYLIGVEWEDDTVAYTDDMRPEMAGYQGEYLYTTPEATPFESMLARVGDTLISYESRRYKQQRLVAFSNWPTTDPFDYPTAVANFFRKFAKIDVEHIRTTENFLSGQFASYHVYPYYPDYFQYMEQTSGEGNTYYAYLKALVEHHSIPVVISEFGASSSRGMAQASSVSGRSHGGLTEEEQGRAIAACYEDIMAAGCAGSIVFSWQDEWYKNSWNTLHAVDLTKAPYWSDYQTAGQSFGLLAFDPGEERSVSYGDGDLEEWGPEDVAAGGGDSSLSIKYDEKFLYLLAYQQGFQEGEERLFIPLDITPESGSNYCSNYGVKMEEQADFLVVIDGKEESRVLVQERYEVLRAMYGRELEYTDPYANPPDKESPLFKTIQLPLTLREFTDDLEAQPRSVLYETGALVYGNANPSSEEYNSLADFCFAGDYVEIRLPWQLLNFSCPAEMLVHGDYYEHYGVENLEIDSLGAGIGLGGEERIPMERFPLEGWGRDASYHERLKQSYYAVQEMWAGSSAAP